MKIKKERCTQNADFACAQPPKPPKSANLLKLSKLNGKIKQKQGREFVQIKKTTKSKKVSKNLLTKEDKSGRIVKLSQREQKNVKITAEKFLKHFLKKFQKTY